MNRSATRARDFPDGFGVTELLVVIVLMAVILVVSVPAFQDFYLRHQVRSAEATIEAMVQQARMSALKEKIAYRLLVHDENASTPNTIEFQREQGGSFVTVAGEMRAVPGAIRILGITPTDSLDSVTVSGRGECTSGNVYVAADGVDIGVVTIASTCHSNGS